MNVRGRGIRTPSGGRRTARLTGLVGALASAVVLSTLGAPASLAAPAADFPSWADVQAAKRDEASARAQLTRLNASIAAAQVEVDRTQKEAELRGTEYAEAQQAYDEQVLVTQNVQRQQEEAQAAADKARLESTQFIANLAKQGNGGDLTTGLLGDTGDADGYLYRIGAMQKVSERSDAVYSMAVQLQNVARSLAEQEEIEQAKLEELRLAAEAKFLVAQQAAEAAAARYAELQEAQAKAQALVVFLTERREVTEADYLEGLRQQWGSGAAGEVSASGWARPAGGWITSHYGMRVNPVNGAWMLHTGVDLAGNGVSGAGCNAPIYAAHAGVVTYAGWYGSWGYYVQLDHGDGTGSGYAHIVQGGIGVSVGQHVGPGQLIAKVGTTGMSTGCHLHFIVRVNGNTVDPVPFMRNQGITLG